MKIKKYKTISLLLLTVFLSGCPIDGDNGKEGQAGAIGQAGETGEVGATGLPGINCWDLNGDRINDTDEDTNTDGIWDANDCTIYVPASAQNLEVKQSIDVEFNHQHICEALATLGQYPEGCPSNTHTVPSGNLTRIKPSQLFDDGNGGYKTCNAEPSNGLLSIESRPNLDDPNQESGWFVLDGGYIAKTLTMPYADAVNGVCQSECLGDSNCIAALALERGSRADCSIFYHSDTVSVYERICSPLSVPGYSATDLCVQSLGGQALWDAKCP